MDRNNASRRTRAPVPTEKAQARSDRSVDPFTQTDPAPVKDLDPFREISLQLSAVRVVVSSRFTASLDIARTAADKADTLELHKNSLFKAQLRHVQDL